MEFRVVGSVNSVDVPGYVHKSTTLDKSVVPTTLTQQIPIVSRCAPGWSSLGARGQAIPVTPDRRVHARLPGEARLPLDH